MRIRRALVVSVCLISVVGVGAGCSPGVNATSSATGPAEAGGTQPGASALPPAEGKTQYPVTLSSPFGDSTLQRRPERISVVNVAGDIDILAALGVTPTGAPRSASELIAWAHSKLPGKVETEWESDAKNLFPVESIAASKPDLILSTDNRDMKPAYDKMAEVAPVLTSPTDRMLGWRDKLTTVGKALDLQDRAAAAITKHEKYMSDLRATYPQFKGKKVSYLAFWGGQHGAAVLNGPGSEPEALFSEYGFTPNPALTAFGQGGKVSDEMIAKLDADAIIVVNNSNASAGDYAKFINGPLFQKLSAVKAGRLVEVDMTKDKAVVNGKATDFSGHIGFAISGYTGPLGREATADILAPALGERLK